MLYVFMKNSINILASTGVLFLVLLSPVQAEEKFVLSNGVEVQLYEKPFHPDEHKIEYCGKERKFPCKIDGEFPYGTDFTMPKTEITKIVIVAESISYELDTSGMYNALWRQPLEREKISQFSVRCENRKNCLVNGFFSDGAGTYVAGWKIVEGKVSRNVLSADEQIMFPFMESIR
jgi:hypothetical protein